MVKNKFKIYDIIMILISIIYLCVIFYGTINMIVEGIKEKNIVYIIFGFIMTIIFGLIGVLGINKLIKNR